MTTTTTTTMMVMMTTTSLNDEERPAANNQNATDGPTDALAQVGVLVEASRTQQEKIF